MTSSLRRAMRRVGPSILERRRIDLVWLQEQKHLVILAAIIATGALADERQVIPETNSLARAGALTLHVLISNYDAINRVVDTKRRLHKEVPQAVRIIVSTMMTTVFLFLRNGWVWSSLKFSVVPECPDGPSRSE
jgi:hypothetical protein